MSKVSIITPVYNAQTSIELCAKSVLSQGKYVLEHIFIDDGSTDDSLKILRALERKHSHVKVFTQENQGAGTARNLGIKNANGKYIFFLDSDDEWLPGKVDAQVEFMEKEGVLFSYGDYFEFDVVNKQKTITYKLPDSLRYKDLLFGCPIGCLTAGYNQELLGKIYMPDIRRGQDWGLWLAITRNGAIAQKYPGIYAKYNVGLSSLSKNKFKKLFNLYEIYRREERLGIFYSIYCLYRHFLYFSSKRKRGDNA